VTLGTDVMTSFGSPDAVSVTGIDELLDRLERGEFDLVAVGRALIANPAWAAKVKAGTLQELRPFDRSVLSSLL
jgi:2,4-dienoyl-CoA reductase-like NADH-dependent reductase (Old Yellow Enzyme family)